MLLEAIEMLYHLWLVFEFVVTVKYYSNTNIDYYIREHYNLRSTESIQ